VKAQLLVADGKAEEALATVRQAVANEPQSPQAQYALGRLLVARGDNENAMKAFNEALRLNPALAEVEMELAKLYFSAGRVDQAEQFARSAATKNPGYAEAQILVAHIDLLKGRLEPAERTLQALVTAPAPVVQTEFGRLQLAKKTGPKRVPLSSARCRRIRLRRCARRADADDLEDKHLDVARARLEPR
jgi:Flp pilus assembly protein TadD